MVRREQTHSGPELEVVSGFHTGVSLALEEGSFSIGSTPDADIVLRDPGVAAEHAMLRIEGRSVRIEAIGGDLSLGDEVIEKGHGCKLRLPVEIALGGAKLRLLNPSSAEARSFTGRLRPVGQFVAARPLATAGGLICCALAVTVATRQVPSQPAAADAASEAKLAMTKTAFYSDGDALSKLGSHVTDPLPQTAAEEAASQFLAKMKSLNISSLRVTAADRRVVVSGNVPQREAAAWASLQQWFDETYGSRLVLTANVVVGENRSAPALRLQAIWFGERPYVITEDGAHYYEGALLENGWVLQRIAEDRVVLERQGESLALTYR
jgi:hypothetical protein